MRKSSTAVQFLFALVLVGMDVGPTQALLATERSESHTLNAQDWERELTARELTDPLASNEPTATVQAALPIGTEELLSGELSGNRSTRDAIAASAPTVLDASGSAPPSFSEQITVAEAEASESAALGPESFEGPEGSEPEGADEGSELEISELEISELEISGPLLLSQAAPGAQPAPGGQPAPGSGLPVPLPDEEFPEFTPPRFDIERIEAPEESLPEEPLPELPPAEDLLPSGGSPNIPGDVPGDTEATIQVKGYEVEGSTVFDADELAEVTAPFVGEMTFAQLLQARSAITQLYVDNGYVTSGAFIPPQTLKDGIVTVQILEGSLEDINISGNNHLKTYYVRDRLALAGAQPLNVNQLLEGLRLLQLDPLINTISADLQAGIQPGTSLLEVAVTEADPFSTTLSIDNARSPSVGTFRRKIQFNHDNLIGLGDGLTLAYSNTDGSNSLDVAYDVPFNAKDGTVRFAYGRTRSNVIEDPFTILDISAKSRYYELTVRQPVERTPTRDIALGLTFSRQESQTELGIDVVDGPFQLSPGANLRGETKISALRFFQEWSDRNSKQVLAARSQFSLGVPWFEASDNEGLPDNPPDSDFFSWRAQGQWVRLLAPETLLLMRGDIQIADRNLVPLEQFGIGGSNSVRGYRQDSTLTDSGIQFTTEVRVPIARIPSINGVLQLAPFIDVGRGWNNQEPQPDTQTLLGTGLGLLWRHGNNFSARVDWGYPLIERSDDRSNWQENGIYFSVDYTPF